jgi:leader peptidase (prepilin peptidase)/N-methyltransferase
VDPAIWVGGLVAFFLGASVGSFLNVVIYRLPAGESVVHPRSRCGRCGETIAWYDNLPVLSYLLLRGRCRSCGAAFSVRYPIVELLTAMVAVALYLRLGLTLAFFVQFAFACALLAITYIDLDHQIIPDRITLPGILVGVAGSTVLAGGSPLRALGESLLGMLLGGGLLLGVAWAYERFAGREGMGGGDVKLLAMIGAFLGWQGVLLTLLLASCLGSAVGLVMMIAHRADSKLAIPFGPFLSAGALTALFWGKEIVRWYMNYAGGAEI